LAVVERVVGIAFVAQRNIQVTIRPEMNVARVVIGGFVCLADQDI